MNFREEYRRLKDRYAALRQAIVDADWTAKRRLYEEYGAYDQDLDRLMDLFGGEMGLRLLDIQRKTARELKWLREWFNTECQQLTRELMEEPEVERRII